MIWFFLEMCFNIGQEGYKYNGLVGTRVPSDGNEDILIFFVLVWLLLDRLQPRTMLQRGLLLILRLEQEEGEDRVDH
jgi:hypothetical protein